MKPLDQQQEVRPLKELYQLVLSAVSNFTYKQYYICNIIDGCLNGKRWGILSKISDAEAKILLSHFQVQRPTKDLYPEIYNNPMYLKNKINTAWFTQKYGATRQDMINIRVKLLNLIIDSL